MTTFAVLATGPSMSQEIVDQVRGRCRVVVVNDNFRRAPWADALVANDRSWWNDNPDAIEFKGRKFSGQNVPGCERIRPEYPYVLGAINSGLQAMRAAHHKMGATRILLCGFDMKGATRSGRTNFKGFLRQFSWWDGCPVINCTPGSALKRWPYMDLNEALRTG